MQKKSKEHKYYYVIITSYAWYNVEWAGQTRYEHHHCRWEYRTSTDHGTVQDDNQDDKLVDTVTAYMNKSILQEINGFFLPYGFLFKRSSVGSSVAKARLANVSIMRLTQSSWIVRRGVSPMVNEPRRTSTTATTLTVSWN